MLVSPSLASTSVSLRRALRITGLVLLALVIAFPIVWVLFIASNTTFGPAVDDPKDFLITLLNGVTAAALYFTVASGFTLIFGLMRVVNMAHGAFFLLGGYIALELQRDLVPGADSALGISSAQVSFMNWFLPLMAAGLIVGGVGLLMQQAFLRWNQGQELRQALITIADLDHRRRPDARPLRRRREGHLLAQDLRQVPGPAGRGRALHAHPHRHPGRRPAHRVRRCGTGSSARAWGW